MIKQSKVFLTLALAVSAIFALVGSAMAGMGKPTDWGWNLQEAATPIAEQIHEFHNLLLWIITIITIFVMALLLYVMVRFREKANPTPSRVTHNTKLEVAWTIVPILILLFIAIPSFKLLYAQYDYSEKADVTIKAIGQKWYWDYVYPDYDELEISQSYKDVGPKHPLHLLKTDEPIFVPVNKTIDVLVTADATGVIHAWTVPSFGVKADAVPGRVVRVRFKPTKTGSFYGQCSELCGKDHAYMPIEVKVVSQNEFDAWIKKKQDEE